MATQEFEYETFELLIGASTDEGYPVSVVESPAGETEGASYCTLSADDTELQYGLDLIATWNANEELFTSIGSELFAGLFVEPIATLFRSSLALVRSQNRHLRLRLRIEPPELHTLPWELLYDPDEKVKLATAADIALVRHFPQRIPVRPTEVRLPLRLLVAISMPVNLVALDVEREKAIIQQALSKYEKTQQVTIQFLEQTTPAALLQALRAFQPHIFHFIGHGTVDNGHAYAIFEDESGRAKAIDETTFREICASSKETRLVVLNACQSAAPVGSRSLTGLAPSLLQRQISAVVAMQYPIRDDAALVFTRHFYHSLASGFPVDLAISEARRSIFVAFGSSTADWIAPVLYLRAKNGKLFAVAQVLSAHSIEIPAPPTPAAPPVTLGFVGREPELMHYRAKLTESGIAVIVGMPGCGKTSIAAQISAEYIKIAKVFWHDFRRDEGADVLIWKLAGFLAWHGQPSVWQMLHGATHAGNHLPPFDVLLDYLLQAMRGMDCFICLDDFQHLENDPLLEKLSERLHLAVLNGEIHLVIASQRLPDFVLATHNKPLAGLSIADTRQLLAKHNINLDEPLFSTLYSSTEGNTELLILAIHLVQGGTEINEIVERLVQAEDVKRFLLNEVDHKLDAAERETMNGVAILLGHPGTRDAIEEVLGGHNIRRTLTYLLNRYLLQEISLPSNRAYIQHGILQEFYYDLLSRQERQMMHSRAAKWYETEEFDLLRSSLHHLHAGDSTKSVSLATQDVWSLINRGQSSILNRLLQNFDPRHLSNTEWLQVKLAQGIIYSFWGQSQEAKACYQEVLSKTEHQPDDASFRLLQVRAYRGLGELLQLESPQDALVWLEQGLRVNDGKDLQQGAGLHIAVGTIQMWLGNYQLAKAELNLGLEQLPPGPSQLRATALENLGVIAVESDGDMEAGIALTLDALQVARQIHDHFKAAEILTTLGSYRANSGDWSGALMVLHEALTLAQQIGSDKALAFAEITLGTLSIAAQQGKEEDVLMHLENGLRLARQTRQTIDECVALMNLSDLHIQLKQWQQAREYLDKAENLIEQFGDRHYLPFAYFCRAQIKLGTGDSEGALMDAQNAVALAREVSETIELGIALRVLGKTYHALGDLAQANRDFAESVALLTGKYPYELARTQASWAKSLLASGKTRLGISLYEEAKLAFQSLGARRDLSELEQ